MMMAPAKGIQVPHFWLTNLLEIRSQWSRQGFFMVELRNVRIKSSPPFTAGLAILQFTISFWTLLAGFRLKSGGRWVVRLYGVERQAAYTKGSVFLYTLGTWCVLPCCLWLCAAEPWLFESSADRI